MSAGDERTPAEVLASIPVKWDHDMPVEFLLDQSSVDLVLETLTEAGFFIVSGDDVMVRHTEVYPDHAGGFRWRAKGGNGEKVAASESYTRRATALEAVMAMWPHIVPVIVDD